MPRVGFRARARQIIPDTPSAASRMRVQGQGTGSLARRMETGCTSTPASDKLRLDVDAACLHVV